MRERSSSAREGSSERCEREGKGGEEEGEDIAGEDVVWTRREAAEGVDGGEEGVVGARQSTRVRWCSLGEETGEINNSRPKSRRIIFFDTAHVDVSNVEKR